MFNCCKKPVTTLLTLLLLLASQYTLANSCLPARSIDVTPIVNGWGLNEKNHRYTHTVNAGINIESLTNLSVKWVFALPDTKTPHTQPLITPDTVYIGDEPGTIYALDRESGCEKWRFDAGGSVRTALRYIESIDHPTIVFGTTNADIIAIDASTGEEIWRTLGDEHDKAIISGSPIDYNGVVYVPVSSWEAMWAANPFYACCTFRSSLLAIDPSNGHILWRAYMIDEEAKLVRKRRLQPDQYGPSGAPVWSQPTIDSQRNLIYVGTGENYSSPATDSSDAIIAFDLTTGKKVWSQQFLANDAWNVSCVSPIDNNCPEERGVDLDFGAPPILATINGRDYILAGQKNGYIYALDPDNKGEMLWQKKPGNGGKLGGVHFAMAVDEEKGVLYVPISDRPVDLLGENPPGEPSPSLHAFEIISGNTIWRTAAPDDCNDRKACYPGLSAAVTATSEIVFAPSLDGHLRAFDAATGKQIWAYDTNRTFPSANGLKAEGGSIDLGGVYLDGGELFVSSGYGVFDQKPGNAFIVMHAP